MINDGHVPWQQLLNRVFGLACIPLAANEALHLMMKVCNISFSFDAQGAGHPLKHEIEKPHAKLH